SHLTRFLLQHGQVRVLDDLSTGALDNLNEVLSEIEFIRGSVADPDAVREAIDGCTIVFHLAAQVSVPLSMELPTETFEVNVYGTQRLLEAARRAGCERFVFASSAAVYGDSPRLPKREGMSPAPISPYGWSKHYGELLCRDYCRVFGVPTVCFRFFNVYGPCQNPRSQYAAVVPRWITAALTDRKPIVFGDGKQVRDFIYVEDLIQGIWLGATHPDAIGKVFNLASGARSTLLELLQAIERAVGYELYPEFQPPRPGDIRRSYADISLIQRTLGYQPRYTLQEGIQRTVAAYQKEAVCA
ncbi:MAG: NAD-dependent epimerase/dehydratase family protein, partial [Fimbriimonadales bacterium]|nr:NAD-dependent epimerase/dehydratase family protein [Fimbriimonadales bacterium]